MPQIRKRHISVDLLVEWAEQTTNSVRAPSWIGSAGERERESEREGGRESERERERERERESDRRLSHNLSRVPVASLPVEQPRATRSRGQGPG